MPIMIFWVLDNFFGRVFLSSKTSAQCKVSITSTATLLNEYYSHVTFMSTIYMPIKYSLDVSKHSFGLET